MRLIAVAMIRNEADILPDFLGHCAALFDEVLVVDHASTDGTSEMLAAAASRMPLTVLRYVQQPYVQSMLVTALAHEAFARGADWVFPLDADEFPMVAGRDDLVARLPGDAAAVRWRWRNLWPIGAAGFARFDAGREYEALAPQGNAAVKVAISRRVPALQPGFVIGQGSHSAGHRTAHAGLPQEIGTLAHVPIRNRERFVLKSRLGARSLAATPSLPEGSGHQWRRAADQPERFDGAQGLARLRRLALRYPNGGDPGPATQRVGFAPLGQIEGLPSGLLDPDAVLAREAALTWRPVPDAPTRAWRIARFGDTLALADR